MPENKQMPQDIPLTPLELKFKAMFQQQSLERTVECCEDKTLLDYIEQSNAFPAAEQIRHHLFTCAYCRNEYTNLREALASVEEAKREEQSTVKPQTEKSFPLAEQLHRWLASMKTRPLPLAFAAVALLLLFLGVRTVYQRQAAAPNTKEIAALKKEKAAWQQKSHRQEAEFQRLKEANAELLRNKQALIAALNQKNSEKNKIPTPQFGPRKDGNTEIAAGNAEHFQLADAARTTLPKLGKPVARGGGDEYALISPKAQIVEQEKPEFHWQKFKNADKYVLTVMNSTSEKVFDFTTGKTTFGASEWRKYKPLSHGKIYIWSLKAYDKGKNPVQANGVPGSKNSDETDAKAQFAVLDKATFQKLQQNRQRPQALVVLYANAGMFDQAEAEIKRFEAQNHNSLLPKQWRKQIERLRQQVPPPSEP